AKPFVNRLGSASEGVSGCALQLVARTSHWRRGDTHAASAMFLQSCQRFGGLGVCPQLSHCDPCVSTPHRMHRQVLIAANRKDDAHWWVPMLVFSGFLSTLRFLPPHLQTCRVQALERRLHDEGF